MKCPECGGTGCMPSQFTLMLTGICDRCGGTGWVDDDEFDSDMESMPDGWEEVK